MSAYEAMGILAWTMTAALAFGVVRLSYAYIGKKGSLADRLFGYAFIIAAALCAVELAQWVAYLLTTGGCP